MKRMKQNATDNENSYDNDDDVYNNNTKKPQNRVTKKQMKRKNNKYPKPRTSKINASMQRIKCYLNDHNYKNVIFIFCSFVVVALKMKDEMGKREKIKLVL